MNFEIMDALYTKLLKINHLMSSRLADIAREEDLNPSELMIVLDVKNNPHTDLQSVCDRLGMKKSTASKAIRKLIEVGYIENHVCETDQRKVSLVGNESSCHELCKESTLLSTFKDIDNPKYDVDMILSSLDDLLEILSPESTGKSAVE
jgi:DNA-binding MarR family transcriptional regulator